MAKVVIQVVNMVAGKVGMVDGVVEAAEAANNCKKQDLDLFYI